MGAARRLCGSLGITVAVLLPSMAAADSLGQSTTPARPTAPRFLQPPKNPYGQLFLLPGQDDASKPPRMAPQRDAARGVVIPAAPPTIVCGMRLIPADPAVDPGIRRAPDAAAPRPTIRAVEPTLCR